jgi:hypothetical protein
VDRFDWTRPISALDAPVSGRRDLCRNPYRRASNLLHFGAHGLLQEASMTTRPNQAPRFGVAGAPRRNFASLEEAKGRQVEYVGQHTRPVGVHIWIAETCLRFGFTVKSTSTVEESCAYGFRTAQPRRRHAAAVHVASGTARALVHFLPVRRIPPIIYRFSQRRTRLHISHA